MKIKLFIKKIRSLLLQPIYILHHNNVKPSAYIRSSKGIQYSTIGDYCWINRNVGMNHVVMGNYCSVASQVLIGGMEHSVDYISTSAKLSDFGICNNVTHIGNDVWIGSQVVIKQGIFIGNGAVIGANSFVNKDVPPYAIVAGSPARIIRFRFDQSLIYRIEESKYWLHSPNKARIIISEIYKSISVQFQRLANSH